ncbi:hypothetical protein [Streptosporangium sp. NPDC006007]|uniref:hypothetical protein n=1 Tax=Streptosporangium sp. NPDC006007 TaxID=3154575 RepID=UPI0033A5E232
MARDMTHGGRKPGNRKPYAWERGLVKSTIPTAERPRKCKSCWTEPGEAGSPD